MSGSELAITSAGVLTFASAPDYETKSSYTATVTASDGVNSTTQSITVSVTDVNDNSPVFTSSATFTAAENQTAIGTVTATDADGDAVTFIVSGSELAITSAGVLTFVSAPDYETKSTYTATVTATDGTYTTTQAITVNVTNVNDNGQVFTSSTTFSAVENQTAIDTVTATDRDGDSVTFTVSGSDLEITSAGVLTFASAPDYETKSTYTAKVTATDGTYIETQAITVNVTNVNDNAPVFNNNPTLSAPENQTSIYERIKATDADGDSVTFTVSGSELAMTSAGVLTFVSAPDYETKSTYTATVTATDGTYTTTQAITIGIRNVNEAPTFTSSSTFSAAERQTFIDGSIIATDDDGDSITYSISSGFIINSVTGVIRFTSNPDYETKSTYKAKATASDGTNSITQDIIVNILNVNDIPPVIANVDDDNDGFNDISVAENQTAVTTLTATTDHEDTKITWTMEEGVISGAPGVNYYNDLFAIGESTGVLTFKSAPDFESPLDSAGTNEYLIRVRATDDGGAEGVYATNQITSVGSDILVIVTNINDNSPIFTSSATFSANENQTAIGTVTATDADGGTVTFTVSGSELEITSAGVLTFASAPDYKTKATYTSTVTASDGTNTTTQDIIVNVNDASAFTSSISFSAEENQTTIDSVSVTDPENATLSYTLSGTDASSLAVSSSGVLSFGLASNCEFKNLDSATVAASDGTNSTTQDVTISVTDVNDALSV